MCQVLCAMPLFAIAFFICNFANLLITTSADSQYLNSHRKNGEKEYSDHSDRSFSPVKDDHVARYLEASAAGQMINITISASNGIGSVMLKVHPEWAPLGAQRFLQLVNEKFYDDARFFRVIKGFMAQVGIAGDPKVSNQWRAKTIPDDPVLTRNVRGTVSFAHAGKNTRTSQIFFNFRDNSYLDGQGFAPFAEVVSGMNVIDSLYNEYGEGGRGDGSDGRGPNQGRVQRMGNEYLNKVFPKLSYIITAQVAN